MATTKDNIQVDLLSLGPNAEFTLEISSDYPDAKWELDSSVNKTAHLFGSGGSSGPLTGFSVTTKRIVVTNGSQTQNWSFIVTLADSSGNKSVEADPGGNGTIGSITLSDATGVHGDMSNTSTWDIHLVRP